MTDIPRSHDEIVARIKHLSEDQWTDWLGTQQSDLIHALPFDLAKPWLKDEVTTESYRAYADREEVHSAAVAYLDFAWGKCLGHRGISASRSIDHYRSWLWLLFDDETVGRWEAVEYPQYGAPILAAAGTLLSVAPPNSPEAERMIAGEPCTEDCQEGCGED